MNNSFFRPFMRNNIATNITRSKVSVTSIISNLEKTISTINQVIPIYKEVKPLVSSSKSFITSAASYFKRSNKKSTSNTPNVIDANVSEVTKENKKEEVNHNITSPSKPFFI